MPRYYYIKLKNKDEQGILCDDNGNLMVFRDHDDALLYLENSNFTIEQIQKYFEICEAGVESEAVPA